MQTLPNLTGRVLVLGEDTRSFLTVIRSLGRAGLEVHVAWCNPTSASLKSRYISRIHWFPDYHVDGPTCPEEFLQLLRDTSFDLMLPCHDSAIVALRRWREQIEPAAKVYLVDEPAFKVVFSKQKTYELAEHLGISLPRQRIVHSVEELEDAAREFGFPLVLKPQASVELENAAIQHRVIKLWSRADFAAAQAVIDAKGATLIQENFVGVGLGVEVLAREGKVLTAFQHERLHEPLLGGGSSYRRSVPLDSGLFEATQRLIQALNYTGVAMVEFKRNAKTGSWILIEINGRFWGSLPLSVDCGIDFPRYLYEMLCLGKTQFASSYKTSRFARNWLMDLYWLRENFASDRSNHALMTVPLWRVAIEFLNPLLLKESSDTFTFDDPGPALVEVRQLVRSRFLPRFRRLAPVRSHLQRRGRKAAIRATRILFVCKGNICRSPFAEAALRALAQDGFEVRSAGYYPVPSRACPEYAVLAATELGIDLSEHRSRVLDAETADWADAVFCFDFENEETLRARFPRLIPKLNYLGALDAAEPLEVADPFAQGMDQFRATYRRIFRLTERICLPEKMKNRTEFLADARNHSL